MIVHLFTNLICRKRSELDDDVATKGQPRYVYTKTVPGKRKTKYYTRTEKKDD